MEGNKLILSNEQALFLKKIKKNHIKVIVYQFLLVIISLGLWEVLVNLNIINGFICSSPSRIFYTIKELIDNNNLFIHIFVTLKEVIISFLLGISFGFIIALLLYQFPIFAKVIDPFLTMLNSLPKIALGPLIIIIVGSNIKSIILMALLINLITSIITIYNGFLNTDEYQTTLFKTLHASKGQILKYLVIPSSYQTIISSLKISISQTLIGVIMGEFLVSKAGIGYLIVYGKQVFNLNLVMSGIVILALLSFVLYKAVTLLEKKLLK